MTSHPSPRLQPIELYIARWLFIAIGISLGGCASKALSTNSGSEKLQVVTTSTSITDFTKVIAGDYLGDRLHQRAQVTQLLPVIALHDNRPKLADVQQLAKADVLVKDGLEKGGFLNSLVAKAKNANLKTIDSSQGVQTIVTETIASDDRNLKAGDKSKAAEHDPREFNSYI